MVQFEVEAESVSNCFAIRPNKMLDRPRRNGPRRYFRFRCDTAQAPCRSVPAGNRSRPLAGVYGMESRSGACNCLSSSRGRLTVRLSTRSETSAITSPSASPAPASKRTSFFRVPVTLSRRRRCLHCADVGNLGGIKGFVDPALLERGLEVFVIRLLKFLLPLELCYLRTKLGKLFDLGLNVPQSSLQHVHFRRDACQLCFFGTEIQFAVRQCPFRFWARLQEGRGTSFPSRLFWLSRLSICVCVNCTCTLPGLYFDSRSSFACRSFARLDTTA